jgi:hypothetical protein
MIESTGVRSTLEMATDKKAYMINWSVLRAASCFTDLLPWCLAYISLAVDEMWRQLAIRQLENTLQFFFLKLCSWTAEEGVAVPWWISLP